VNWSPAGVAVKKLARELLALVFFLVGDGGRDGRAEGAAPMLEFRTVGLLQQFPMLLLVVVGAQLVHATYDMTLCSTDIG
jgi:hypothetical protein